jgi:hypothetical protein
MKIKQNEQIKAQEGGTSGELSVRDSARFKYKLMGFMVYF